MKPRWRQAIDAWTLRRVRRQAGPVGIGRRQVYILPTRFGWGFALMSFVMLLGATNYANSMGFALCFLLAALGLVSLHHTHANLVNLRVRAGHCEPVFAGDALHFQLIVDNPARRERYDLRAAWRDAPTPCQGDLPAAGSLTLTLPLATTRRGLLRAPAFSLSTEFPLGLFRAWTWIELDLQAWVYPRAIDTGAAPDSHGHGDGAAGPIAAGDDDFIGLRAYRSGDSLSRVHWKRMAIETLPQVKQFGALATPSRWFDWHALPQLDPEARLSQLSWWVSQAQETQAAYGLRLPGRDIGIGHGEDHRRHCLLALAMFQGG